MIRVSAVATTVLLALAAPAAAQSMSICDTDPANFTTDVAPSLVGNWTANNFAGIAVVPEVGFSVPLPAEGGSPVDIVLRGNDLAMTSWLDPSAPMLDVALTVGASEVDRVTKAMGSGLTLEEVSVVQGCDVSVYPTLVMTFTIIEDDTTLNYTSTLHVLSDTSMVGAIYGTVVSTEGSMQAYRPISLSR